MLTPTAHLGAALRSLPLCNTIMEIGVYSMDILLRRSRVRWKHATQHVKALLIFASVIARTGLCSETILPPRYEAIRAWLNVENDI